MGLLIADGKAVVVRGRFANVYCLDGSLCPAWGGGFKGKVRDGKSTVLHELLLSRTLSRHHMDAPVQKVEASTR